MATSVRMCSRLARSIYGLNSSTLSKSNRNGLRWSSTATETNSADSAKSPAAPEGGETIEQAVAKAEEAFQAEKEKLTASLAEMQDKYKRSLAETENVRVRMKKQIDDAKRFGIQGFCKDLLEVADILNKATESVPPEQLTSDNPHLTNLYEGLTMTESQLTKVFTRHGLVPISPAEGEKFNPNVHEALFEQPAPGKEPGTVAVVTKTGYLLHSRTLRPALVGVFKAA